MRAIVFGMVLMLALPEGLSAGPLREAIAKAGRELAGVQPEVERRSRTRVWTGWSLIAAGAVMATLGSLELGDDESGPDDGEDFDDSDDGEDSDGWGNKALVGGGVAAATAGGVILLTGRRQPPNTSIVARPGLLSLRHTLRF
jgi:hypothetical protein